MLLWSCLCDNKPSLNHSYWILCSLELKKKKKIQLPSQSARVFICAKAEIAPMNSRKCSIHSPWCHQKIQVWRESCACNGLDGKPAAKGCDLLPSRQAALTTLLVISSQIYKSKLRLWRTETKCEKCAAVWCLDTTFMLIVDTASPGLRRERTISTTFRGRVCKICICQGRNICSLPDGTFSRDILEHEAGRQV